MPAADPEWGRMSDITRTVDRSSAWLLDVRRTEEGGWGDVPGRSSNTLNTAEAITALIRAGRAAAGDESIVRAVAFLKDHQAKNGPDAGAWPREVGPDDLAPDIIRTAAAVRALILAGETHEGASLQAALSWMLSVRNEDGGWGFRRATPTRLPPTCFALWALLQLNAAGNTTCDQQISHALERLADFRRPDGSFGDGDDLAAAHTMLATLTLQDARERSLSRWTDQEEEAIRWLLQRPDLALRVRSEDFPISSTGSADYPYVYQTDALLLSVLAKSRQEHFVRNPVADEALRSVADGLSPEGGVYGRRVFTWATARVVTALDDLAPERRSFAAREPTSPAKPRLSPTQRYGLMVAAVLVGVGVLAATSQLAGPLLVAVYLLVILGVLLATGSLAPPQFLDALQSLKLLGRARDRSSSEER